MKIALILAILVSGFCGFVTGNNETPNMIAPQHEFNTSTNELPPSRI